MEGREEREARERERMERREIDPIVWGIDAARATTYAMSVSRIPYFGYGLVGLIYVTAV